MTQEVAALRVLVIGTGLIGTSIALALRGQGAGVWLCDRDLASARLAAELGAGTPLDSLDDYDMSARADLVVLAVPPDAVAVTLLDIEKRGLARFATDVASVKAQPVRDAVQLGCDLRRFVPGHPLAGRERSGPAAARADLFLGRPWALCPGDETDPEAVAMVTSLVRACGAEPLTVAPAEHDRAVALVSHAPHVVSSAMAASLTGVGDVARTLAGQGVRDVTRIAGGDPLLWTEILTANAGPVADVLDGVAAELAAAADALRSSAGTSVTGLLDRGVAGRRGLPGKHGGKAAAYAVVSVLIPDRPGELALLLAAAGVAGVNIEDVAIEHSPGLPVGVVELSVQQGSAARLAGELRARGWSVPR